MHAHAIHLLFPNVCIICSKLLLAGEEHCCSSCASGFDPFQTPAEAEETMRHLTAPLFGEKTHFARGWCRYRFHKEGPLQEALHAMKYQGLFTVGTSFGRQLGEWMVAGGDVDGIDSVVPIPLHPLKKIERSYNQAEKIAEGISQALQKPLQPELLWRNRYTASQTGLSASARKDNLEGAFTVGKGARPRHVLLVDDVVTTGSTMAAAAQALCKHGVEQVSLAAVALAMKE